MLIKLIQFSRGAVLTEIGGNLISSFKLIGYSPAQEFALNKAATKLFGSNMPVNNLPIINDVYWVAFIIYYGLIGLAIYFFILYRIFKASVFVFRNSTDPYFPYLRPGNGCYNCNFNSLFLNIKNICFPFL